MKRCESSHFPTTNPSYAPWRPVTFWLSPGNFSIHLLFPSVHVDFFSFCFPVWNHFPSVKTSVTNLHRLFSSCFKSPAFSPAFTSSVMVITTIILLLHSPSYAAAVEVEDCSLSLVPGSWSLGSSAGWWYQRRRHLSCVSLSLSFISAILKFSL